MDDIKKTRTLLLAGLEIPPDAALLLVDRLEAAEKDAERYRFLRNSKEGIEFRDKRGRWRADCPRGEELDAAIDDGAPPTRTEGES